MAGRGPAPSERVRRRNVDPSPGSVVSADGKFHGPPLPRDVEWHPRTRDWWQTWRRSPQATTFTETDWSFLLDTALMHDAMWSKKQWTLAAEVRLRAAKFGATPEDRARLRMRVGMPEREDQDPAPSTAGRARLKVVGD